MNNVSKPKKNIPVSLIVHSTNTLGFNLAKTLAEQGSKVILIEKFDSESKKSLLELKKYGDIDFVDIKGLENLMQNISKVDYLFYIQSDFLLSNQVFESKDFLEESNNLNQCLKVVQKFNSKFSLITTVAFNEKLIHAMENLNYSKPSPYSAEELQKYSETLVAEYHDKSKINARIVRLGTILGLENNVEHYPEINQLFQDAVKSNSINIQGEGLDTNYLVHIHDAIYGILKLTFSTQTNGEVITLANNNEYTMLSIAYKILELNPEASEIKFIPDMTRKASLYTQYIPAPSAEEYEWKQKKTLEDSISETLQAKYQEFKKNWKVENYSETTYKEKLEEIRRKKGQKNVSKSGLVKTPTGEFLGKVFKPFKKKQKKKVDVKSKTLKLVKIILFLVVFYFLLYPLIAMGISGGIIYVNAKKLSENYSEVEEDVLEKKLKNISTNSSRLSKSFEGLNWAFNLTQQQELYTTTSQVLYALQNASEGLVELSEGVRPLLQYFGDFEPALDFEETSSRTTREYSEILREIEGNSAQVERATYKIAQATSLIDQANFDVYPNFLNKYVDSLEKYNLIAKEQVLPLRDFVSFLPDVLGVNERKRYLILLQNPTELRSTGGWISSYALVGLEGGQIRELKVDDVYNLDGELVNQKKFFDAPEDMQKALDISEWGLSLSNWDADFQDSASNASFFVQEAGVAPKIDGVLTIDIHFLQGLLSKWGGISIPGERELITSENIHEKIFDMHENFTPGESQKATFLASLADETITKLLSSDAQEYSRVFDVILSSLDSKHILVFMNNQRAQQYFSERGWDGKVSERRHRAIPFTVEWNWGANKANLYLEREEKVEVDILKVDEIEYVYSLFLKNNSTSQTYPQGEYTNYARVFLPEDSEIISVKGFKNNEYEEYLQKGFKVLGGWFNVPTQATKELKVEYITTESVFETEGNTVSMPLNLLKQPGTGMDDIIRVDVFYPEVWSVTEQDGFEKLGNQLTKQTRLDTDKSFNLNWVYR